MRRPVASKGFTLVELLVALAILGIIVVVCGRIFEQSNVAWNTGSRKAEINMVGRGVADFIAQDLSRAVARTPADLVAAGTTLKFKVIDEAGVPEGSATKPIQEVTYNLSVATLTRNGIRLAPDETVKAITVNAGPTVAGDLPGYVDVEVQVYGDLPGPGRDDSQYVSFKSRAWLANRDRYKYDQ